MNLTDNQKLAIKNCIIKSKMHEKNLIHLIQEKFIVNNIDVKYIDKIINYINNYVSLTTKMKYNTLEQFIQDPILKNSLELKNKDNNYINYRKTKEDTLFHNAYKDCVDSDRVKYGSLNLKNLISGDPLASGYGETTIFYKNDIKDRVSFLYGNSESSIMYVCTFKHFKHLLYHMPISDIKIFVDLIDSKNIIKNFSSYVEIQIHGKVDLINDVEKITIPQNVYNTNKHIIDNFIWKYNMIDVIIY